MKEYLIKGGLIVLGASLSIIGGIISHYLQASSGRKSLRKAIKAELEMILAAAQYRKHEEYFYLFLEDWKQGRSLDISPTIIGLEKMLTVQVFEANLHKVGELGDDVARDICYFYGMYRGIIGDIIAMPNMDINERISLLSDDLQLWQELKKIADSLISRL